MQKWHGDDSEGMLAVEGQFTVAVIEQYAPDGDGINLEVRSLRRTLDRNLPDAD